MDPGYLDIDSLGPKDTDSKGPESVPITDQYYAHLKIRGCLSPKPNGGLEPPSFMPEAGGTTTGADPPASELALAEM